MEKDVIVSSNLKNLLLNIYNEFRKKYGETVAGEEVGEIVSVIADEMKGAKSEYTIDNDFQQLKEFAKQEVNNAYNYLLNYTDDNTLRKEFIRTFFDIIGDKK